MDVICVKTINGKPYNSLGQELIKCRLCGGNTTMLGTKLCDRCWELETRIQSDMELAEKILRNAKKD
jgi:hypothetical protein